MREDISGNKYRAKKTNRIKKAKGSFCVNCGTETLGEVNFCPNCGNAFKKVHGSKDNNVSNTKDIKSDTEQKPRWNFKVKQPVYKYAGYDPPSLYEKLIETIGEFVDT